MTREQIKADIAVLDRLSPCGLYDYEIAALTRSIARLRADLARMDGPAEGARRWWVVIDPTNGHTQTFDDQAKARRWAQPDGDRAVIVVADVPLPLPRVVEVEGTVVE